MKPSLAVALLLLGCVAPAKGPPTPEQPGVVTSQPGVVTSRLSASDPHVRATGRVDRSDASSTRFAYSGVTFELAFEGEGLTVELDDRSQSDPKRSNHYQVVVDGKPTLDLAVTPGVHEYTLASALPRAEHRIALYKRTEASVGRGAFRSFGLVGDGARALGLPARPTRRLEIVGDSITRGYGNEAKIEAPPGGNPSTGFTAENEDHYGSYGALAARLARGGAPHRVHLRHRGHARLRRQDERSDARLVRAHAAVRRRRCLGFSVLTFPTRCS